MFFELFRSQRKKNSLLALLSEMNSNLEHYHVIDQRQFISAPFLLNEWENAKRSAGTELSDELCEYAARVEELNFFLEDSRIFEEHYVSSMGNKTRVKAQILHDKKEVLLNKAMDMRPYILAAQKAVHALLDKT